MLPCRAGALQILTPPGEKLVSPDRFLEPCCPLLCGSEHGCLLPLVSTLPRQGTPGLSLGGSSGVLACTAAALLTHAASLEGGSEMVWVQLDCPSFPGDIPHPLAKSGVYALQVRTGRHVPAQPRVILRRQSVCYGKDSCGQSQEPPAVSGRGSLHEDQERTDTCWMPVVCQTSVVGV